jgi:hypothetical protein
LGTKSQKNDKPFPFGNERGNMKKKKEIVVLTKKFGYITGFISATKKQEKYTYTMIDHNGNPYVLGTFDTEQLAKVKRVEEDLTYDYSSLV